MNLPKTNLAKRFYPKNPENRKFQTTEKHSPLPATFNQVPGEKYKR